MSREPPYRKLLPTSETFHLPRIVLIYLLSILPTLYLYELAAKKRYIIFETLRLYTLKSSTTKPFRVPKHI